MNQALYAHMNNKRKMKKNALKKKKKKEGWGFLSLYNTTAWHQAGTFFTLI
jgi:hypothetical protein